jgi:hypothetical protein
MPGSVSMMMRRGLAGAVARTESFEVAAFDVTLTDEDFARVCGSSSPANSRAEAGNWAANPLMAPAIARPVELAKNLRRDHGDSFSALGSTSLQFPSACDFPSPRDSRFMRLLPRLTENGAPGFYRVTEIDASNKVTRHKGAAADLVLW